jgi:predicted O-methyltransferase YrrM
MSKPPSAPARDPRAIPRVLREAASRVTVRGTPIIQPRLRDLWKVSERVTVRTGEFVEFLLGRPAAPGTLTDGERVLAEVDRRRRNGGAGYPADYAVTPHEAIALYALARELAPAQAVETGVADGVSSAMLLSGLSDAHAGRLTSVDLDPGVGSLVRGTPLAARWDLQVVPPGRASGPAIERILRSLAPIGLFFHDSAHDYAAHRRDLLAAYANLGPGGLIVSDDVDNSFAFCDVAERVQRPCAFLVTPHKVLGGLTKPTA